MGKSVSFELLLLLNKDVSQSHKPKAAVALLPEEQGEFGASGIARDRRQISYSRQKSDVQNIDPLFSIMTECKLAQGPAQVYVRYVKAGPFSMCVLGTEWHLVRVASINHHFCV